MTADLLTVEDVARITCLSPYTIRKAVRECDLQASRLRGRIRIHPDDLAAWVDAGRVQPHTAALHDLRAVTPPPRAPAPSGGYRQAVRDRKRAA